MHISDGDIQSRFPFLKIDWVGETNHHYVGRCPFCGDSKHHLQKGHMYVSKSSPVFICHRCGYTGNINQIENLIHEKCRIEYDSSYSYNYNNRDIKTMNQSVDTIINSNDNNIDNREFDYIRNRCNLGNDNEDNIKSTFRIVSDEIVKKNFPDEPPNMINNRVWFLTALGTTYIGRSLDSSNTIRYIKYTIPGSDGVVDSYIIDNYKNLKAPTTLVIAEGIFDIIPIFLNSKKYRLPPNAIYSACLGIFYNRSEKTFQHLFKIKPKNIFVFCDVGVDKKKLESQFITKSRNQKIVVNVPMYKDWNEVGPIKISYQL